MAFGGFLGCKDTIDWVVFRIVSQEAGGWPGSWTGSFNRGHRRPRAKTQESEFIFHHACDSDCRNSDVNWT
jgi:hypothetical protein